MIALIVLIPLQGGGLLLHVLHDLPEQDSNIGACDCTVELGFVSTKHCSRLSV